MMKPLAGSVNDDPGGRFEATRWSVVVAAGQDQASPAQAHAALTQLCQDYWTPLYGFVRRRGHSLHDAQDLPQGFFAHLIEQRIYTRTDRAKGKFRSFLLASLSNFLSDAHDRERALKRGGARVDNDPAQQAGVGTAALRAATPCWVARKMPSARRGKFAKNIR